MAGVVFVDFIRTLSTYIRFGNLRIKDSGGALYVRNGADSADAGLIAASLRVTGGVPALNKILVCQDGNGNALWADNLASVRGQAIFTVAGDLEAAIASPFPIHNRMGASKTILEVFLAVSGAPVGADLIVDVNKNGTTIFSTQSNRPKILAGEFTGYTNTIDTATWAAGETINIEVDQVGSSSPGTNLIVHVVYQ